MLTAAENLNQSPSGIITHGKQQKKKTWSQRVSKQDAPDDTASSGVNSPPAKRAVKVEKGDREMIIVPVCRYPKRRLTS